MIAFHQLRCFAAVAEELHFRRAAARLNMTQPPLTRQIQLLEHALGVRLLERDGRRVRLTRAGAAFLVEARRLLAGAENAALVARRVARGEIGTVSVGFTAAAGYAVLPRLVARVRALLPEIELNLREMVSGAQIAALEDGGIDFGLLRPPVARGAVGARRIGSEPLVLALPDAHPLAGGGAVEPAAIAGAPLITYPPVEGRYLHDLVMGMFQAAGVAPGRVQHISQTHSILALVGAGLGVALVPRAAARFCPAGVSLRPLRAPAPAEAEAELLLAWRRDGGNAAAGAVLDQLRRDWSGLGDAGEDAA